MTTEYSSFPDGEEMKDGDQVVGLRSATNYRFDFPGDGVKDSTGAYFVKWVSAGGVQVNYPEFTNSITGVGPTIASNGTDASSDLNITSKLNGDLNLTAPGTGDMNFSITSTGDFVFTNTGGGLVNFNATTGITGVLDEDTMVSDSATHLSTQQATKAYVDTGVGLLNTYTYITQTAHAALTGSQNLAALSTGVMASTTATGVVAARTLTGTANQVDIASGDGSANPTWTISSTLVLPGTATLGGNLDVTGYSIVSTSDGDINITPNGSGEVVLGETFVNFTATEADSHALEIDCDTANFADVKALDIFYDAGTLSGTQDEGVALINIDESLTTGGEIFSFQILSTAEGSANVYGTFHGVNVAPLLQLSGTFGDADSLDDNGADVLVALSGGGAGNVSVFEADNETFTIGDAATYEEVEFIVDTGASGSGIAPTWEYSTGAATWATFSPVDGTNGFRNTGAVVWLAVDLAGWATSGGEYLIRITRTRNSLSTTPILDLVQIVSPTEYSWDKDGVITAKDLLIADDIQHTGDSNNKIAFGTDTQSLETGGTSRIDLSDSGVRLGGANSRVTTILDEDAMGSDSATALATQQSIKAYVDNTISALESSASLPIELPTSSEDLNFFFTNAAVTITEMRAVLVGSSTPSVTWTVRHGTDRSAAGAEVVTGGTTTTSVTTGSDVTSFNDATVVADSFLWVETTAQSGTVDSMLITVFFTYD